MTVKTLNIALSILLLAVPAAESAAQGLGFHGMECRIEQRTSWKVFGERPEVFEGDFRMDFELRTLPSGDFGYFFRMKDRGGSGRIWNMSYDSRGDSVVVRINEEGRYSLVKATIPHVRMKPLLWHACSVVFDLDGDSVSLEIDGERFSAPPCGDLPDRISARIEFGRSDHIIDVPAFSIRNLHVGSSRRTFFFPLNQRSGNAVPDMDGKITGKVQNPEWLVNEAMEWKEMATLSYSDIAGAAYNPARKEFCYFTRDGMTLLSLMTDGRRSFSFGSPCPVAMKLGHCFISGDGNYLYVYELFNDEVPEGSPSVARYCFDSGEWTVAGRGFLDMPMHHHGCFRNPATGQYTVLGGFGDMLYNGNFYGFEPEKGKWERKWAGAPGDPIFPRYFTSAGTDSTYIYVYGGMGNECGEQVVGRRYFYDLHRIDPSTGRSELLWANGNDGRENVPVRNLCVDGDCFYTLTYPEYISKSELRLNRFSIADGQRESLADSIPVISDKMRTNANIYLDKELGRFFATVQEFEDDIKSTLKIYTLAYPPITESEAALLDAGSGRMPTGRRAWTIAAVAALLSAVAGAAALFLRRRKKKPEEETRGGASGRKIFRNGPEPDTICLFGDFTVTDRDGNDITNLFTNQQTLLLCLLIKRGGNGISTRRLSSILWPDKEEDRVKNSRGVAINNLRRSLSRLDGVGVAYRDGRYYLETADVRRCDWLELESALKDKDMDKDRILSIISRGKFLKSVDDGIFDDFKEKVENIVYPLLQEEIAARFKAREYEAVCEIGAMMTAIDPTDETAMRTVIHALRRQKRTEEALVVYAAFCAEYKKADGSDFPIAFKNI